MRVYVADDLNVSLQDRETFTSFDMVIATNHRDPDLSAALSGVAAFEGADHAWIDAGWLLAQGDDLWRERCRAMIEKVRPYGWVRDNGDVRAHIVSGATQA